MKELRKCIPLFFSFEITHTGREVGSGVGGGGGSIGGVVPYPPQPKFFFYSPLMGFPKDLEGMEGSPNKPKLRIQI